MKTKMNKTKMNKTIKRYRAEYTTVCYRSYLKKSSIENAWET